MQPVVRPVGFEPTTYRLEGGCSNPLSYGRLRHKRTPPLQRGGSDHRRSVRPAADARIGKIVGVSLGPHGPAVWLLDRVLPSILFGVGLRLFQSREE